MRTSAGKTGKGEGRADTVCEGPGIADHYLVVKIQAATRPSNALGPLSPIILSAEGPLKAAKILQSSLGRKGPAWSRRRPLEAQSFRSLRVRSGGSAQASGKGRLLEAHWP